ncbi:MAG: MFS transporter [Rhodocyclaceae bacterium]
MTTTSERWSGRLALMVAHCAGMVDLVALPVWVGTLIAHYGFDPQQAGGLVTLFLVGAVVSSLFFAPRFHRMRGRIAAPLGFGIAALAIGGNALTDSYSVMAALHLLAGVSAACGLSFTHGTIGRSANPHRLFALVGMALGVFAIVFLGATPQLVAAMGGQTLFIAFGVVMAVAALVCALAFPDPKQTTVEGAGGGGAAQAAPTLGTLATTSINPSVWYAVVGIACMGLVQAMIFSFLERIGSDRGFGLDAVTGVLIALGVVNLFPAALAALFERCVSLRNVVLAGPLLQGLLALTIAQSEAFAPYAAAAAFYAAVMIFTHTFAFGLIARLDRSGRVLAATPAMLMAGAAIGPILGGTLVKLSGYASLGVAAVLIDVLAIFCFARACRRATPSERLA